MKVRSLIRCGLAASGILLLATACDNRNARLQAALDAAGTNRTELQAVIDHYADSPEKQAAARWLIANMPGHYGYEGDLLDSVENSLVLIQDIMPTIPLPDSVVKKWNNHNLFSLPRRSDLQTITARMLIDNIDRAYEQWKGRPWNKELSFDDFCEYILPYRLGDERLTDWRPHFERIFANALDSMYTGEDVLEALKVTMGILDQHGVRAYSDELATPYRDPMSLLFTRVGNCRDECALIASVMRSCGIPVAIDHMLPAPDSGIGHSWLSVLDNKTGKWFPFGYDDMPVTRDSVVTDGRVKGKVYRYTYAQQRAPGKLQIGAEVPSAHSRVLDVTANYFGHNRVEVDCEGEETPLLAAWTKQTYIVIGVGKRVGKRAEFADVEPGTILFPTIAHGSRAMIAGYPFIVNNDGSVTEQRPDPTNADTILITRKTPLVWRKRLWLDDRIRGLVVEASHTEDFSSSDTLISVNERLDSAMKVVIPEYNSKMRFIRVLPSDVGEITFAELTLSENADGSDTLPLEWITPTPHYINPSLLSDGRRLSFVEWLDASPIVAKLSSPAVIRRVELTARNDDNFIVPGREYELLWHDGPRGWQSVGRKVATGRSVEFTAPKGAVCIVRCLTTGREEQPFIWRNDRQTFSLDLTKARYK